MAARVTHQSALVALTADSTARITHQSLLVIARKRTVGPTILVELTFGADVIRLAEMPLELEHYWAPWVEMGSIAFQLDTPHGGYFRPRFGGLRIKPPAFKNIWPPPDTGTVRLLMTDTTESAADVILTGAVHLEEMTAEGASYRIYEDNYDIYALDEEADAAGNMRPVARGFGAKPYDGDDGSYTEGELVGDVERVIFYNNFSGTGGIWDHTDDEPEGFAIIYPSSGAAWLEAGDQVYIDDVDMARYSPGYATVRRKFTPNDGSNLDQYSEIDWPNIISAGETIYADAQKYQETEQYNSYESGDYTVDATATPATLIDLFAWGCARLGVTLNADQATDAPIAKWQSSQVTLIDFLSSAAAFHCHFFRIIDGVCYLVDMEARLSARSLFMILGSSIRLPQPIIHIASRYEEVGVIVPYSDVYSISTNDSETAISIATTDMRQILIVANSSAVIATLDASMAVGDWISLIKGGAGTMEIKTSSGEYFRTPYDAGTGVTSAKDNTTALWSIAKLVKLTATEWYIETVGDWDFS
jgi:hypothetical protein